MRVLVFNWRDPLHPLAGGAEVYTDQVLRRWAAQGHEAVLFAAAVRGRPACEELNGYRVVRAGGRLGVYREARSWWREHGAGRFDAVVDEVNTVPFHAHEWVDDGTAVVPLIHQTAEDVWRYNTPLPVAWLGRRVLEPRWLRRLRGLPVLAVSESTRASLQRFGLHDVTVVPEGYEPPPTALPAAKEELPTAVFCGRMVGYKRPADAARAVEIARREIPDLRIWMIGDGPELAALRAKAPAGVRYLGRVSEREKHDRLARAHVHLATSVREGWGLVVTEAAAVGTPTIAYDVPGLRDSTRAASGVVVPPKPEAMARWLVDLLPRWRREPPAPVPHGGARSWDEVARTVLERIRANVVGSTVR